MPCDLQATRPSTPRVSTLSQTRLPRRLCTTTARYILLTHQPDLLQPDIIACNITFTTVLSSLLLSRGFKVYTKCYLLVSASRPSTKQRLLSYNELNESVKVNNVLVRSQLTPHVVMSLSVYAETVTKEQLMDIMSTSITAEYVFSSVITVKTS